VPEKIMTLDVALRLKPLLEKAGYKVVMTRSTDVFVPLGSASPSPILIPTPFLSVFISTPPRAAELTGSRHISIAPKARRSLPVFIPLWLAVRPRKTAASGVAAILFCAENNRSGCADRMRISH
jgi:hypothetical protein